MPALIPALPAWTVALGFWLGAIAGSFLNMVIYRLPRAISFVQPAHSICPVCKHALGWRDLVPLLSWLSTRGKCRYCGAPIAPRYFWVEVVTGGLFAAVWWATLVRDDDPLKAAAYLLATAGLVAAIWIDWELFIIPDELNAFLLAVGLGYGALAQRMPEALWGAFTGWGLLWGITLLGRLAFGKDAMGHGDIKLMRGTGAVLGPLLTGASLMMAVVVGLVVGLALMALAKRRPEPVPSGDSEGPEETVYAEPIASVFKLGLWYLLCLDVLAIFFPRMYGWIGEPIPPKGLDEEDDWKPSATTIPFGPYLAAGCLVCMVFEAPVRGAVDAYLGQFRTVSAESP